MEAITAGTSSGIIIQPMWLSLPTWVAALIKLAFGVSSGSTTYSLNPAALQAGVTKRISEPGWTFSDNESQITHWVLSHEPYVFGWPATS